MKNRITNSVLRRIAFCIHACLIYAFGATAQTMPTLTQGDRFLAKGRAQYDALNYDNALVQYGKALTYFIDEEDGKGLTRTYRELGFAYYRKNEFQMAKSCFDSAYINYQRSDYDDPGFAVNIFNTITAIDMQLGDFLGANRAAYLALDLCREYAPCDSVGQIKCAWTLQNIAIISHQRGFYQEALDQYEVAVNEAQKIGLGKNPVVATCYHKLANLYRVLGDYAKALQYVDQSIETFRLLPPKYEFRILLCMNLKALIYGDSGDLLKEAEVLEEVIRKRTSMYGANSISLTTNKANLGNCYLKQGEYGPASRLLHAACEAHLQQYGDSNPRMASDFLHLASLSKAMGDHAQQIMYAERAVCASTGTKGKRIAQRCQALIKVAQGYSGLGETDSAQTYYMQAQHLAAPDSSAGSFFDLPAAEKVVLQAELMQILRGKAEMMRQSWDVTGDLKFLISAFEHSQMAAIEIVKLDQLRMNFGARNYSWDKLWIQNYGVFEDAIATALQIQEQIIDDDPQAANSYLEKAFFLADRSKARLLSKNRFPGQSIQGMAVPTNIKKRDWALQEKLRQAQDEQWMLQGEENEQLEQEIFELEREYEKFRDCLKSFFPRYFAYRYEESPPSISDLRASLLPENRALIAYFWGEGATYAFLLSENALKARTIPMTEELLTRIDSFRSDCENRYSSGPLGLEAEKEFFRNGYEIYKTLLPFKHEIKEANRLLIVPDGPISALSFSALPTEDPQAISPAAVKKVPFLIRTHAISYANSCAMASRATQKQKALPLVKQITLFFASLPASYCRKPIDTIVRLPHLRIHQFFPEDYPDSLHTQYSGAEVNKQNFEHQLGTPGILHAMVHGIPDSSNDHYSYLLFPNDAPTEEAKLYNFELYKARTDSIHLAVLGACHSGYGTHVKGFSSLSIARGFRFGGCPSVMTSRWAATENTSNRIYEQFYAELLDRVPLDIALQKATVTFLDDERTNPISAQPRHWAHLAIYGAIGPLKFAPAQNNRWLMLAFFSLTGFVFIAIFSRARRKRRQKSS
ncbi:MAG: CHAT domain-containing tetratricopeptide repeat protein [Bacteroidota bacterium]